MIDFVRWVGLVATVAVPAALWPRLVRILEQLARSRADVRLERERRRTLLHALAVLRPGMHVTERDGRGFHRTLRGSPPPRREAGR
ncbi:hypothetical protein DZF91_00250 [Actinomadura logoneensis]|uniref:Uncharacterized protein n=1 Tax=Actinomadura logoneensis TaxID=2293572 RepID=A0A372JUB7_9ACTN|nr:hypothetical protein [Actinomadura logoneensis]RFU43607.1 hypothetical protein DZF91_00250 [Actinomadura logoneensis]